ncbi:hypothetical protein ACP4OV_027149 [Aristida adscensionis]
MHTRQKQKMDLRPPALLLMLVLLLPPLVADASNGVGFCILPRIRSTLCTWGRKNMKIQQWSQHLTTMRLLSFLGDKDEALKSIVYSYKHGFSGFAAELTESQVEELKKYPGVISVKPSAYRELHTTRSWDFLGLNYYQPSGLLKKANYGEDVIIGIIDTGIWPESPSFDDTGYGPVPKRWKGACQTGEEFDATSCNKKIIGARWYAKDAAAADLKSECMSARDTLGHGTHTASTAAGGPVRNASYGGQLAGGVARGGASRARVAVYKACWSGRCTDAGVLAAVDDAISDGVDVLSISLGDPVENPGTLHAVARGLTLVFSAGNGGPVPGTVQNASPWLITVAASTIDRSFPTTISLGNKENLVGQSLYLGDDDVPSVSSSDFQTLVSAAGCSDKALKSMNVTGKVVLCFDPWKAAIMPPRSIVGNTISRLEKGKAKGMIFAQSNDNLLDAMLYCEGAMACVLVDYEVAHRIAAYIAGTSTPVVKISPAKSVVGKGVLSPRVAWFSSKGPSIAFPAILKPDVTAPGVSILSANGDISMGFMSGTSMACPHVSGVVALLKSVHFSWSPAMIKSAIVTTALVTDRFGMPIQAEGVPRKLADPFDFGGGHIDPDRAVDPGLVYDIDPKEYTKFFNCTLNPDEYCSEYMGKLYLLNLPSIIVPDLKDTVTVWRTVTNVGPANATYRAEIVAPAGISMSVEPSTISFKKGGQRNVTFKVTFTAKQRVQGGYTFGSLTWLDGGTHSVRIPVVVRTIIQDFVTDIS